MWMIKETVPVVGAMLVVVTIVQMEVMIQIHCNVTNLIKLSHTQKNPPRLTLWREVFRCAIKLPIIGKLQFYAKIAPF